MNLSRALARGRTIRAIGFDDAPFDRGQSLVNFAGIVCNGTRFEGMIWGALTRDGRDATEAVVSALQSSKFLEQVHLVLLDGICFGGFNVVDLEALAGALGRPCAAVMRRTPDLPAFRSAMGQLSGGAERLAVLERAGPIREIGGFTFQSCGAEPAMIAQALAQVTDRGLVPEPLRLAHLIGAAIKTGQSSNRA